MKKIRLVLPILTVLFLLIPGMSADAEARVAKFAAGAETGKITIHIWDMQTLEGTVKVKAVDGGEIHLESVSIATNDPANTEVCDAFGNKVYMSSNGALIKTSITINVSFVEDGEYLVTLTGGCTDKNGKYKASGLYEEQSIIVGEAKSEEEEEEEEQKQEETSSALTSTAETKQEETTAQTTTAVTDEKTDEKEESSTIVRNPQVFEEKDDDEKALEELAKEAEKAQKEKNAKSNISSSNLRKIIIIVILAVVLSVLAVVGYLLWKRKNAVEEEDYEGAATLDYDIEDDDIVEDDEYDTDEE